MWTVCPSTMSNNSFHARLNQGSSKNRLGILLRHSQRPTRNICCQLPAGLENVLNNNLLQWSQGEGFRAICRADDEYVSVFPSPVN